MRKPTSSSLTRTISWKLESQVGNKLEAGISVMVGPQAGCRSRELKNKNWR